MAISEKERQALQRKLDEVLGPKDAWALMEEVSGRNWGDLATRIDLDHLGALTKRDMESLEGRMDARFEGLEGRMDARFESVDARFESLEGRMDARFESVDARFESLEGRMDARFESVEDKIDGLGHRLEAMLGRELGSMHQELGKVYKELAAHTRTTVFACIAAVMTSGGVALASTRL